eukprot:TRINITY_DN3576_c0_g1_i3.p1 TRINITY_DN3576_c0_g1~~TRINITY_DN3576_c0_g1_i3.p1  ORF type:complete len:525 (-),score=120.23 TRINITY_DN3576_c0_g1_i3:44-1618(-)
MSDRERERGDREAGGGHNNGNAIVTWSSRSMETVYRQACAYYEVRADPAVTIAIKSHSSVIKPQKKYDEELLLPLVDLLAKLKINDSANSNSSQSSYSPLHFDEAAAQKRLRGDSESGDDSSSGYSDTLFHQIKPLPFNITWLQLGHGKIGSNGAILLAKLLELNPQLTALDISNNNIGPRGARALGKALMKNSFLKMLDLHGNHLFAKGAEAIADAIKFSQSLTWLNVANCGIGFAGLTSLTLAVAQRNASAKKSAPESSAVAAALKGAAATSKQQRSPKEPQKSVSVPSSRSLSPALMTPSGSSGNLEQTMSGCCPGHLYVNMDGNLVVEEIMNGVTHGIGIVLGVIGTYFMMTKAMKESSYHVFSAAVYCFSLLLLFTSSCLFHSFFKLGIAKVIFQVMDHLAIFVMIAGSYTPFLNIPLHGPDATTLLIALWAVAVLGILQDIYFFDPNGLPVISLVLYLAMGWLCVIVYQPVMDFVPTPGLWWTLVGGLFYTFGVPFYVLGEKVRYIYHAVWHLSLIHI